MFNCYRRCKTTRDLVEFCKGYNPGIELWVRKERSRGVSPEVVKSMLYAIKAEIIRNHEEKDLPEFDIILSVQNS